MDEAQRREAASAIKSAFEEGYGSYETPCVAYNTEAEAWEKSTAKTVYDKLMEGL